MRALRLPLLLLALLALGTACDSPTGSRPAELAGEWWSPVRELATSGPGPRQERRILRLDRGGEFRWTTYWMGEDGLPLDRVSTRDSFVGTWRVDDDAALAFRTLRMEHWRHTHGLEAPPRVQPMDEVWTVAIAYTLEGDVLTLRWSSRALDAPQEVVGRYTRARSID